MELSLSLFFFLMIISSNAAFSLKNMYLLKVSKLHLEKNHIDNISKDDIMIKDMVKILEELIIDSYIIKNIYLNKKINNYVNEENFINIDTISKSCGIHKDLIKESSISPTEDYSLTIPLINFNINEATKKVIAIIEKSVNSKDLLAIARGMGTGKTRTIEEIRLNLQLCYDNILAIPITFTSLTDYEFNEEYQNLDLPKKYKTIEMSVMISVTSRLLFMTFQDLSLVDASTLIEEVIKKQAKLLPKNFKQQKFHENLFIAVIEFLKKEILRVGNKKVDSFVLFIDETARVSDSFALNNIEVRDVFEGIRSIILGDKMENYCKAALVISSLLNTNFLRTSGRRIDIINLPQQLEVKDIVDKIWTYNLHDNGKVRLNDMVRGRLMFLASICNTIPRLVEIVDNELKKHENDMITRELLKEIYDNISEGINERYKCSLIFPNGKYMKALINNEKINFDKIVSNLIKYSAYTNQIEPDQFLSDDGSIPNAIIPIGNIKLLETELKNLKEKSISRKLSILTEFENLLLQLFTLFSSPMEFSGTNENGILLEEILIQWSKIKLLANLLLNDNSNEMISDTITFTLGELFKLNLSNIITKNMNSNPLNPKLFNPYNIDKNENICILDDDITKTMDLEKLLNEKFSYNKRIGKFKFQSSYYNILEWAENMNNALSSIFGFLIPIQSSSHNECYDLGLCLNSDKPMIVFIDTKSENEVGNENTQAANSKYQNDNKTSFLEYFDTCQLQDEVKVLKQNINPNSYLNSFLEGRWIYVYMTTYNEKSQYYTRNDFIDYTEKVDEFNKYHHQKKTNEKYGSLLVLNRKETLDYLGLIKEPYQVIRNIISKEKK